MSDYIQRLIDSRASMWDRAKKIMDTAAFENRELNPEEQVNLDQINVDLEKRSAQVETLTAATEREQRAEAAAERYTAIMKPSPVNDKYRDDNERIRAMGRGELRELELGPAMTERERRDILTSSTGAPVPTSFYDKLMVHMIQTGPMRRLSTVISTSGGENLQVPRTTAFSTAAIIGQAASITESDPTFGAFITLGAFKYAYTIQLSGEMLSDSGVDLTSFLAENAGTALAVATNAHYTVGTGSGQPNGIVPAATAGVTGGTGVTGAFTADNLIDLIYSVNSAYRSQPGCVFQMRDSSIGAVRKLKDTTNQYLWQPSVQAGQPDNLLGFPLISNPDVVATALSAKSVVFGVVPRYYIREAGGVRIDRSDDFAFQNDLVTFRVILRADGNLIDTTGAVKVFTGGAT